MDRECVAYVHILNIQPVSSVLSKNRKGGRKNNGRRTSYEIPRLEVYLRLQLKDSQEAN